MKTSILLQRFEGGNNEVSECLQALGLMVLLGYNASASSNEFDEAMDAVAMYKELLELGLLPQHALESLEHGKT